MVMLKELKTLHVVKHQPSTCTRKNADRKSHLSITVAEVSPELCLYMQYIKFHRGAVPRALRHTVPISGIWHELTCNN